jgi:uncharacterized membrane protein YozB (DUF420 family)
MWGKWAKPAHPKTIIIHAYHFIEGQTQMTDTLEPIERPTLSNKSIKKVLLFGFSIFIFYYLYEDAWPFLTGPLSEIPANYIPNITWLKIHVAGGITMLSVGLFQFLSGFFGKGFKWHKITGRIYLGGLILGLIGFWGLIGATSFLTFQIGLSTLAFVWLVSASMALWAIWSKNIPQHREWMSRNYTATFGFLFFRLFIENPSWQALFPSNESYLSGAIILTLVVPWLMVECFIQGQKILKAK